MHFPARLWLALSTVTVPGLSQTTEGEISGRVLDSISGKLLAARIECTQLATLTRRLTLAGESGYRADSEADQPQRILPLVHCPLDLERHSSMAVEYEEPSPAA